MKKLKKQKGITLIALVITIIILLILAGISILSLIDNGLFGKTQDAKVEDQVGKIQEGINLWKTEHEMSKHTEMNIRDLETFLQDLVEDKLLTEDQANEVLASETKELVIGGKTLSFLLEGETPPLKITDTDDTKPSQAMPEGAIVIENDPSKGIVIADKNENEWVWVEVPKTIVFTTAQNAIDYENIKADLIAYTTDYRINYTDEWYDYNGTIYDGINQYSQPKILNSGFFTNIKNYYGTIYTDKGITEATEYVSGKTYYVDITKKLTDTSGCGLSYEKYKENYEKMLSSVYENGGFWISRYEIGDATSTASNTIRISNSGTSGTAVSKPDQIPYNYVTCSQAQILASGMSTDSNQTSSLLFGIQWQLTCKFIEEKTDLELAELKSDSTEWGNYSNNSLTLNRGRYNSSNNVSGTWIPYTTDTENYVTNKQKLENMVILLTTGASEETSKMNIYDFAGNLAELTLEHYRGTYSDPWSNMGGCYNDEGNKRQASEGYSSTNDNCHYVGFRTALY